ncbi:CDP-alcohol phosphatidyltransferase family protein [Glycomyces sp. NRRL B-16210]|uniref:CDP-alcohol phosphatidyltransferase family protein n=1 Tax=Glycomyces sp. NRRL B-16210 TaxID=1463821 RepID=UPI0009E0AC71|nr:CDP-alcohol phosphatidyltransferase family protein [Glycomyces sp. NRRL B-16210]
MIEQPAARATAVRSFPIESLLTVPNAVTLVRTVAGVVLAVIALVEASVPLLVAAYVVYWIGDMLDGWTARRLGQETRIGAVFDIISDRACTSLCAAALLMLRPDMAVPLGIFLVQFMVIDCLLSLAFLYWPIVSPNYFYEVHRGVYRWNWSPPAKALNTAGLVVLVLFSPTVLWPIALTVAVTAIKVVSIVAVARQLASESAAA